MSQALIAELTKPYLKAIPKLKTGYTVRVHQKIKEGDKERIQIFEGLIIKMNGGTGVTGTVTVRKISEGIGVEKIFPIHSPNIVKIEVKKIAKVRRSKLYYMRDLSGKSARLKEKQVSQAEQDAMMIQPPIIAEIALTETVETNTPAEEVVVKEVANEETATEEVSTEETPNEEEVKKEEATEA